MEAFVIFDMDGVLVDSEPLWFEAEREVFANLGLELTEEMYATTSGLRIDAVMEHWKVERDWGEPSVEDIVARVVEKVCGLMETKAGLHEGVREVLALARNEARGVALASSSPERVIATAVARFDLGRYFDVICSGENEELAKPHPALPLTAARLLSADPQACTVVEDSLPGVIAAKAARMHCVAIPKPFPNPDPRFVLADVVLPSLTALKREHLTPRGSRHR